MNAKNRPREQLKVDVEFIQLKKGSINKCVIKQNMTREFGDAGKTSTEEKTDGRLLMVDGALYFANQGDILW